MIDHIAATIKRYPKNLSLLLFIIGLLLLIFGTYRLINPSVQIEWTTASEVDTLGFNLMREDHSASEERQKINPQLIMAVGSPISGETYHFLDANVKTGKSYTYHLREITLSNEIVDLESINVRVKHQGLIEIVGALGLLVLSFMLARAKHNNIVVK